MLYMGSDDGVMEWSSTHIHISKLLVSFSSPSAAAAVPLYLQWRLVRVQAAACLCASATFNWLHTLHFRWWNIGTHFSENTISALLPFGHAIVVAPLWDYYSSSLLWCGPQTHTSYRKMDSTQLYDYRLSFIVLCRTISERICTTKLFEISERNFSHKSRVIVPMRPILQY